MLKTVLKVKISVDRRLFDML